MWTRWIPWRFIVSKAARAWGFLDPVPLLARLERLAQASEVTAPVELLRAGARFHARGLVNARVLQYNLDWVWPYWVERQYDPGDDAFIPRAFSLTHVNLTHRNWTAVGIPGVDRHPLVDPRGLVTPLYDGWSLDAWLIPDEGEPLLPSRAASVEQTLLGGRAAAMEKTPLARSDAAMERTPLGGSDTSVKQPPLKESDATASPGLAVETRSRGPAGRLTVRVDAVEEGEPVARIRLQAEGAAPGWMALAVRPANPEGVALVDRVERPGPALLRINERTDIHLSRAPDRLCLSDYATGDVLHALPPSATATATGEKADPDPRLITCDAGLATAAALLRIDGEGRSELTARIPLSAGSDDEPGDPAETTSAPGTRAPTADQTWQHALDGAARLQAPDARFTFLFDAAVRALVLHAPGEVYPGPFTYKRFWFRDAAFILDALCCIGLADRAREVLSRYPGRQERSGFFRSQEGEWDSNGAALWTLGRYAALSGEPFPESWREAVRKGARWIVEKRLDPDGDAPHAGLLPAGFSAEHLGPNDYFYWDDFWSAAGLRAAARLVRGNGSADREPGLAERWEREAADLLAAVDRSLLRSPGHRRTGGIPASPYRRMDAGAIGSLCASYPLRLWRPDDPRLLGTVEHLLEHHTLDGAFLQDMIHSGLNPYLTLHLAQTLLRAGDGRHEALVRRVADLASSTGQWPEAVHPRTGGGCMGDGQHIWAAAEWLLMLRSWFVREEGDGLILASGIPGGWVKEGGSAELGPVATPWGTVVVRVRGEGQRTCVEWEADWRAEPPPLEVRLPGHRKATPAAGAGHVRVERLRSTSPPDTTTP